MDTAARVRRIVSEYVDVNDDDMELELDSLTLVNLVEDLEDAFDLRISASELVPANFASVAAITRFIQGAMSPEQTS